jgi:protein LSM14
VSFPGNDIKDLFVHEATAEAPPANPPGRDQAFPPQRPSVQESSKPSPKPVSAPAPTSTAPSQQPKPAGADQNSSSGVRPKGQSSGIGTGQHLLHLRVKKADGISGPEMPKSDFDFSAGLSVFNKSEILAKVAQEATVVVPSKTAAYSKDDFFDNISNERMDREEGRKTRLTGQEEKVVNQDTFGAIALQGGSGYRRYHGGRGGRSGQQNGYSGRGGGRGRGDGRGHGRGRGRGNRAVPQAQHA